MVKKKGLGKGLGALLTSDTASIESESITMIKLMDIEPNPDQPRTKFDSDAIEELAESIKEHGVISPIIVKESDNSFYRIVAGERRWRAAKMAGLKEVACIIRKDDDEKLYEISLIENLQRKDLNPCEEALGYKKLMSQFSLTQDELAKKMSKSRSYITNSLRLLNLPEKTLEMLSNGEITTGHAKVLLSLSDDSVIDEFANIVKSEKLSVRELEERIKTASKQKKQKPKENLNLKLAFETIEKSVSSVLGTKVKITESKGKGKILISYYDTKDLERIVKIIEKSEKNDL